MHKTIGYVGGRRFTQAFKTIDKLKENLKESGDTHTEEFTTLDELTGFCGSIEKKEDSIEVMEFSASVTIRLK